GGVVDAANNSNVASTSTDNTVTFDNAGPRVTSFSPNGTVSGSINQFTLSFNEALQSSSFTLGDVVSLTGPGGSISASSITQVNASTYQVNFPGQTAGGTYTLVVGPSILDLAGNAMDQNTNGINGETPGDQATATVTIAGT